MPPTHWQPAVDSFPFLSRFYARERSELVKQGLNQGHDRALARAQIVDPQQSSPPTLKRTEVWTSD